MPADRGPDASHLNDTVKHRLTIVPPDTAFVVLLNECEWAPGLECQRSVTALVKAKTMPSYLDEIRERQAFEASKKSSPIPIVIAAIFAFGLGALGATGFVKLPSILSKGGAPKTVEAAAAVVERKTESVTISGSSWGRLGNAEKANVLLSCVPRHKLGLGGDFGRKIEPADIYKILQAGTQITRVAAAFAPQPGMIDSSPFASLWADVADCAMAQNGWTLCDPDNRALAVEATINLVREVKSASVPRAESTFENVATKAGLKRKQSREYQIYAARATRDRVLDNLRMRVQEGRFVSGDFGYFAPSEISDIFGKTVATRDACAEKR